MKESTALTTRETTAVSHHSIDDIRTMAQAMAASKLFTGIQTEQQAFALMLLCEADGIHPAHALRRYHIINGSPSMKAETMLADFKKIGGKVRWIQRDDTCVSAVFSLDGEESPVITWDDARVRKAQLAGNHVKFPCQMKTARVISEAVRLMAPGIVQGVYTPEEIEDTTPTPATTPAARSASSQARLEQAIGIAPSPAPAVDVIDIHPEPEPPRPLSLFQRCQAAQGSAQIAALLQQCDEAHSPEAAHELLLVTRRTVEALTPAQQAVAMKHVLTMWAPYTHLLTDFPDALRWLGIAPAPEPAPEADPLDAPPAPTHPDDVPPFGDGTPAEVVPARNPVQYLRAKIEAADLPGLDRLEAEFRHNAREYTADEKRQIMIAFSARRKALK